MSIVSPAGSPNARADRRGVHGSPSGPSPLLLSAGFPRSPPSRVHRHRGAHTRTPAGTKLRRVARPQPLAHLAGALPAYGARTRSLCPSPLDPALPPLWAVPSWVPEAPTAQLRETRLGVPRVLSVARPGDEARVCAARVLPRAAPPEQRRRVGQALGIQGKEGRSPPASKGSCRTGAQRC